MRKPAIPVLSVFLVIAATSCRRHDYRTVTIHVPEMKNQACVEIVSRAAHKEVNRCRALHPEKQTQVDLRTRTVTITYDSLKLALKNIEFAIANAGFSTAEVPANKEAARKLPPECRAEPGSADAAGTTSAVPVSAEAPDTEKANKN